MAKTTKFYGTGRRKSSIARVYITPGTGKIVINKKDMDEYFGLDTLKVIVKQPLVATGTEGKYDVLVNVCGGGFTGQAGAIRHGISRALLEVDAEYRPILKKAGYLTRDPRMKERRSTVSRPLVVLHSSQRDNYISFQIYQEPAEVQRFCGFFFSELLRFRLGGTKDMVTLLSKLWIKSDNYKDSKVREKYGVLCGAVGIF